MVVNPVSYTHLDVYKRQALAIVTWSTKIVIFRRFDLTSVIKRSTQLTRCSAVTTVLRQRMLKFFNKVLLLFACSCITLMYRMIQNCTVISRDLIL